MQRYLDNTNVLETTFETPGGAFRVRRLRAALRPVRPHRSGRRSSSASSSRSSGTPRIRVRCDPRLGWSKRPPPQMHGLESRALRGLPGPAAPDDRHPDLVPRRASRSRSPSAGTSCSPGARRSRSRCPALCERFLQETMRYWQRWVKECDVPPLFQQEVIRSALALKLHCFEDTGRDRRGDDDVDPRGAGQRPDLGLPLLLAARRLLRAVGVPPARPLRGARAVRPLPDQRRQRRRRTSTWRRSTASTRTSDLDERDPRRLAGLRRRRPGARRQRARRGSGRTTCSARWSWRCPRSSSTTASAPSARRPRSTCCERLARKAVAVAGTPDAGIWELRSGPQAADLLEPDVLGGRRPHGERRRAVLPGARGRRCGRPPSGSATRSSPGPGATRPGASSPPTAAATSTPRCCRWPACASCRPTTRGCSAPSTPIRRDLARGGWLLRYRTDDGLGTPTVAFILCTFWLVEALAVARPDRRGARRCSSGPCRRCRRSACSRRTTRSERPPPVGQLPAGLLARRPDPRRVRGLAALVGGPVSGRAIARQNGESGKRMPTGRLSSAVAKCTSAEPMPAAPCM